MTVEERNVFHRVPVDLGSRSYTIEIGSGLIANAGQYIDACSPGARCAIVTDKNVHEFHGADLVEGLESAGVAHETIVLPSGEPTKSVTHLNSVVEQLLGMRLERKDLIIAFGGGVIGDLAGFAAAITRRGIQFVQIPTSLLAQVDSSVGGKTGINSPQGKNLIGAFHQPALVLADLGVLKTLPAREFRAGYAEVVKYGLINDAGFFKWLEENRENVHSHGSALAEAVSISCKAKAAIVAKDELEAGERALLNLGHTFGHALEAHVGYDSDRLVHGEGVAIGMVLAHEFSNRMNLCSNDDVLRVKQHLAQAGLPTEIADIPGAKPSTQRLLDFITQDKKVTRGSLTFILTKGIGKAYIAKDVPASEVEAFLGSKLL